MNESTESSGDVKVWWYRTSDMAGALTRLAARLSHDELARAARFRLPPDCDSFVIRRGLLREILADFCRISAEELAFNYTALGKPLLAGERTPDVHFNVSHSHDMGVIAVSRRAAVGVDVERVRVVPQADELARRHFAAEELEVYSRLDEQDRPQAFLRAWTRKEAVVKAMGQGLQFPLANLAVSVVGRQAPRIIHIAGDSGRDKEWTLMDISPQPDYMAALAVQAAGISVSCQRLGHR